MSRAAQDLALYMEEEGCSSRYEQFDSILWYCNTIFLVESLIRGHSFVKKGLIKSVSKIGNKLCLNKQDFSRFMLNSVCKMTRI